MARLLNAMVEEKVSYRKMGDRERVIVHFLRAVVRLNREIGDVVRAPDVETLLATQSTGDRYAGGVRGSCSQVAKWAKLLKPTEPPP
jgi:hypothetical protein